MRRKSSSGARHDLVSAGKSSVKWGLRRIFNAWSLGVTEAGPLLCNLHDSEVHLTGMQLCKDSSSYE